MPRTVKVYDEYPFGLSWVLEEGMLRTSHALVVDGKVWLVEAPRTGLNVRLTPYRLGRPDRHHPQDRLNRRPEPSPSSADRSGRKLVGKSSENHVQ